MGVKKVILIISILALLISFAHAAKITGAIYDQDLTPVKKAILTINSSPEQTKVSQYGGYHFLVDPGTYTITATLSKNQITKEIASETITITQEGEFARDLFVYPDFIIQEEFEDTFQNKLASFFSTNGIFVGIIIGALIILITITVIGTKYVRLLFKRELKEYLKERKQEKREKVNSSSIDEEPDTNVASKTTATILPKSVQEKTDEIIEKRILTILNLKTDHICTQKEIRKEFRLSEAKISLILTNMESKGTITKIKQGRRNMIQRT